MELLGINKENEEKEKKDLTLGSTKEVDLKSGST